MPILFSDLENQVNRMNVKSAELTPCVIMETAGQSRDIRRRAGAGLNKRVCIKVCRGHLLPEPLGSGPGSSLTPPPTIGQLRGQVIVKIRRKGGLFDVVTMKKEGESPYPTNPDVSSTDGREVYI